ncbi:MAG: hypothetical protein HY301_08600 [Verrucomicrobia bacterium]|nr:hypothetical protein [Verrucomicrobiota bacterium]
MKKLLGLFVLAFGFATLHASEVGVRIRFGLTDDGNKKWDGTVSVAPGSVANISGWRFQQKDEVVGTSGWKAETRPLTVRRANQPKKGAAVQPKGKKKAAAAAGGGLIADNGVILRLVGVTEDSVVTVKTEQGNFDFKLADIAYGKVVEKLNGGVDIERTAATQPLTAQRTEDDFPAIAVADDGTTYIAHVSFTPGLDRDERAKTWDTEPKDFSFLATVPGGDQLWLRVLKNGKAGEPIAVTAGKGDIYKTSIALDGKGALWIFWSENKSWQNGKGTANFEIWARSYHDGKLSEPVNVSQNAASDVSPVAAADAKGNVWVAWQGVRDGVFRVLAKHQTGKGWSDEIRVSTQKGSCWTPAIAAARDGRIAIAWDTYDKGDYDVWVREFGSDAKPHAAQPAANTPQYEARPSITYDGANQLWVCWELSGPTWGKDWGAYAKDEGIGLYRDRQIGLRVLSDGKWMAPETAPATALPGAKKRRGPGALPVNRAGGAEERKPGEEAEGGPANAYNNLGRIVADRDGRVWLLARAREGNFQSPLGTVWMNHAVYFDGQKWIGPVLLPNSDNLLYNVPAVAAHPQGGIIVAHSSDHRQSRHIQRGSGGNASLDSGSDPFDNDIYLSRLEMPSSKVTASLKPAKAAPSADVKASADTEKERAEVAKARAYRMDYNGSNLQIIRGEFHRHTEISGDGGNDGPLEDMWRYAVDVAAMDWLGCGDHDNGGGREYTWWLTQKTTDAFRIAGKFEPPFTYERSVRYPEGHRNVVFEQRGVRTLPRLPISDRNANIHAPDTQMLYKYLRQFDGVCASHTSATSMGTDWRDWDPQVEPMVEIYQGCRQNYERPGAPRCPTAEDSIGGWEPLGFVNLAFKKGYRFAFESSSDHGSTHISYALVYAENNSREALLKAMRLRHTYAATDNIIAEYTCKSGGKTHMMGDEFTVSAAPKLSIRLVGTAPFEKVTIVKDDVEIHSISPNAAEVNLTWTDPKPEAGKTSYYYVRGEQKKQANESNGELVWASPMWIKFDPQAK